MKTLLRGVRIVLPCVAVGFFLHAVSQIIGRLDLFAIIASAHVSAMTVSLGLLVALFFADALGWVLVVRSLRGQLGIARGCAIWLKASGARYIPGLIWSYASRAALAAREGILASVIAASLSVEHLLLVTCAALVGTTGLAYAAMPLPAKWLVIGLATLPVIWFITALCWRWPNRDLTRVPRLLAEAISAIRVVSAHRVAGLTAYYTIFWAAFAVVFAFFSWALLTIRNPEQLFLIAVSWVLAFSLSTLLPLLPGGLGVREGILFFLLRAVVSDEEALTLALASRLWVMCGEAISVALILPIRLRGND